MVRGVWAATGGLYSPLGLFGVATPEPMYCASIILRILGHNLVRIILE